MRSYRAPAVLLVAFAATSCGGDGGTNPPENRPPVAAFSNPTCSGPDCDFTDGSTDPDGNSTIASWSWDFGGDGTSTEQNPAHTFSAAGDYDVTLTVTDDEGADNSATHTVTVSESGANTPPTANFTFLCNAEECTFTNTSTDNDGTVASSSWDFDDGSPASTEASPVHTYSVTALTTFSVTLTVTDDDGATDQVTKDVAVAPPATTTCESSPGDFVPCTLDLSTVPATVKVTLVSVGCTATGNKLIIVAPNQETVFEDGCSETAGTEYPLNGGAAYAANSQLQVEVISGSDDPNRIAPAIHVTGSYPEWTLNFDDGEDPSNPNEPDFDDLVLKVTATE